MSQGSDTTLASLTSEIQRKRASGQNVGAYLAALCSAKNDPLVALNVARSRFPTLPVVHAELEQMVTRTGVAQGDTSDANWASPLVVGNSLASEFISLVRPLTIRGRLNSRSVPANTRFSRLASGASASWVKQGYPAPMSALSAESVSLGFAKIVALLAVTNELAQSSSPDALQTISADCAAAVAAFEDQQFLDPNKIAVSGESPASITSAATSFTSSGNDVDKILADARLAMRAISAAGIPLSQCTWLMNQPLLVHLVTLASSSIPIWPELGDGGTWLANLPVLVSGDAYAAASATEGLLVLCHGPSIATTSGGVEFAIGKNATLHLDSAPSDIEARTVVSMFTADMTAIKTTLYTNWMRRRDGAVAVVSGIQV